MIEVLLAILIFLMIITLGILIRFLREHKKLKQTCHLLEQAIDRNSKDIAGICSAAVTVDNRIQGNNERLKALIAKLSEREKPEAEALSQDPPQSYHQAIQKIHAGASAEDLVRDCGFTRDEAMLLMSLHGRKE